MAKLLNILSISSLLLIGMNILGQTPELNEEKYWEYRDRLRNEYMIGIGPGMGMSTPAGIRDTVRRGSERISVPRQETPSR